MLSFFIPFTFLETMLISSCYEKKQNKQIHRTNAMEGIIYPTRLFRRLNKQVCA